MFVSLEKDFASDLPYKVVIPDEQQVLQDGEEVHLAGRVLHQAEHRVEHVSYISAGRVKELKIVLSFKIITLKTIILCQELPSLLCGVKA